MEAAARGLVDQCAMLTLGQLAMFAFAALIYNQGKLFRSIITTAMAPLLCMQCLATRQWPPLRYSCHKCGFEVIYIYIVHQAFLWITMSLMRKLVSSSFVPWHYTPLYVTSICCCVCKLLRLWYVYCPFLCPLEHFCRIYSAFELQSINNLKRCTRHASLWSK